MNIKGYYQNYKSQKYNVDLNKKIQNSLTVKDFYNDCISNNLLKYDDVIAWHNMLMEYVDLPDAILWVRYHESKGKGFDKTTKRHNNRRACLTRFNDGFSYVFVSNFDAHEIFNMISKGIVPSAQEFLSLMKLYQYPMHYDPSKACEESDIVSYPHVGYHAAGILTARNWYLAHINGVKGLYIMPDGAVRQLSDIEAEHIYPRGKISDWKIEKESNKFVRKLNYKLTEEEKSLVKAHFLRFVDPLNYFLTPKTSLEYNAIYLNKNINIGEEPHLTSYVLNEYKKIYGNPLIDAFLKKALIPESDMKYLDENFIIDVTYGKDFIKSNSRKIITAKKATVSTKSATVSRPATSRVKNVLSPSSLNTKKQILGKIGQSFKTKNKIGELFVNIIHYLNKQGKLSQNDIVMLSSDDSKKMFGIRLPAIAPAVNYDKDRYLQKSIFTFNGVDYVITNDWYPKDSILDKVVKWAKTKNVY